MIVEAVILGGSAVICTVVGGSLALVNAFDRRRTNGDARIDAQIDMEDGEKVWPFTRIAIGQAKCIACGAVAGNRTIEFGATGPAAPQACNGRSCAVKRKHLHVTCDTCGSQWLMAPWAPLVPS